MFFSLSLSVGELHLKLTPSVQSSSASSSSSFKHESPIVSIKRRRHRHIRLNESIEGCVAQDAAAASKDIDSDCIIQNEDNCDDGIQHFGDDDDEDIVADLSHFSGTLCISKIRDITADKETVVKEVDAVNNDPSPSDLIVNRGVAKSHNDVKNHAGGSPSKEYIPSLSSIDEDDGDTTQETVKNVSFKENTAGEVANEEVTFNINLPNVMDGDVGEEDEFKEREFEVNLEHRHQRQEKDETPLAGPLRPHGRSRAHPRRDGLRRNAGVSSLQPFTNLTRLRTAADLDLGGTTPLHTACASNKASLSSLRSILKSHPTFASTRDAFGRLPIHIFARNEAFSRISFRGSTAGPDANYPDSNNAEQFLGELFDASPRSVTLPDFEDKMIPFLSAIVEWTKIIHAYAALTRFEWRATLRQSMINPSTQISIKNIADAHLIFFIPQDVSVTPFVIWSLQMLSFLLDRCNRKRDDYYLATIRDTIIKNVSSIPLFCKSILLIDSNRDLERITSLSIVRNSFLNKNAIGPWIVAMLNGPRYSQQRMLQYLQLISKVTFHDLIGIKHGAGNGDSWQRSQSDIDDFTRIRRETFEAVADLPGIIFALRILSAGNLERAATTNVVQYLLNKKMGSLVLLYNVFFEALVLVVLILSFRLSVDVAVFLDGTFISPFVLVFIASIFFLSREVLTIISVGSLSRRQVYRYFSDFWVLIELMAVVLAFSFTIMLKVQGKKDVSTVALAFTTLLLGLKFIGFLKTINRELATFVIAFSKIMKDIKWFTLLLIIALLMFAEIVHGIYIISPELCDDSSTNSETKFCNANVLHSYFRIYSMAVGDIELENFTQTPLISVAYIVFTFFIIIVLLTILIAIVSDSYSKSVLKSDGLFGRARVEYVAKHLARGELLSLETEGEDVRKNCEIIFKRLLAWVFFIVEVCVFVSVGILLVLITTKLSELKDEYGVRK